MSDQELNPGTRRRGVRYMDVNSRYRPACEVRGCRGFSGNAQIAAHNGGPRSPNSLALHLYHTDHRDDPDKRDAAGNRLTSLLPIPPPPPQKNRFLVIALDRRRKHPTGQTTGYIRLRVARGNTDKLLEATARSVNSRTEQNKTSRTE